MTREEIIKNAFEWLQAGRLTYYREGYYDMLSVLKCFVDTGAEYVNYQDTRWHLNEKTGKIYYERFFDQWKSKPTPWYPKSFICRSLL